MSVVWRSKCPLHHFTCAQQQRKLSCWNANCQLRTAWCSSLLSTVYEHGWRRMRTFGLGGTKLKCQWENTVRVLTLQPRDAWTSFDKWLHIFTYVRYFEKCYGHCPWEVTICVQFVITMQMHYNSANIEVCIKCIRIVQKCYSASVSLVATVTMAINGLRISKICCCRSR